MDTIFVNLGWKIIVYTDIYRYAWNGRPSRGEMEASDGMGMANVKLRNSRSSRPNT